MILPIGAALVGRQMPGHGFHKRARTRPKRGKLIEMGNSGGIQSRHVNHPFRASKRARALGCALLAATAMLGVHASGQVEYVDPTIGNVGILLVPTRPTVHLPNSMVRVYPMRTDALNDQIDSFPLTISSHRMHELFSIMPGDGKAAAYDLEKTT